MGRVRPYGSSLSLRVPATPPGFRQRGYTSRMPSLHVRGYSFPRPWLIVVFWVVMGIWTVIGVGVLVAWWRRARRARLREDALRGHAMKRS